MISAFVLGFNKLIKLKAFVVVAFGIFKLETVGLYFEFKV